MYHLLEVGSSLYEEAAGLQALYSWAKNRLYSFVANLRPAEHSETPGITKDLPILLSNHKAQPFKSILVNRVCEAPILKYIL